MADQLLKIFCPPLNALNQLACFVPKFGKNTERGKKNLTEKNT